MSSPRLHAALPTVHIEPPTPVVSQHPPAPATPSAQVAPLTRLGSGDERRAVELLLVAGARKKFSVGQGMTVGELKEAVWEDWPREFSAAASERPASSASLRLQVTLYLGKCLADGSKLSSLELNPDETTVMHLNVKVSSYEEEDARLCKPKKGSSTSWCSGCLIS